VTRGRRAQRFHALVEPGSAAVARPAEYAGLVAVVDALRAVPAPAADPVFVASLRERLVAEAESVLASAAAELDEADARLRLRPATPRARRRHRRLAAAVSGVVIVGGSATMAYAAQSALPGDGLYPLKRGLESAHAELTFDRGARGKVLLQSADTRLDEAQQLARTHGDPSRVDQALDAFTQETVEGSDLLVSDYESSGDRSSITALHTFTVTSMSRLDDLQSEVPSQSLDPLLRAAQALGQVQETSVQACAVCRAPSLGSVPDILTQATQATVDAWQVAVPKPHGHGPIGKGPDGGPVLPHLKGPLPPASVTDPGDLTVGEPSAPPAVPTVPTADDVQHTVQHLTDGLTHNHQNDVASTVTDTANNLLDAVGELGNEVSQTVDGTLGGLLGGLLGSASP
jgi:Domain of unknown function (DUF5667)